MGSVSVSGLFHFDPLAIIMMGLVAFIGVCTGTFSVRYMKGDSQYKLFFIHIFLVVLSVMAMTSADHFGLLFGAWCTSNVLLVRLMVHKATWKAARASGWLAGIHFLLGAICVAVAFLLFYCATGEISVSGLMHHESQSLLVTAALVLLLVGAMTQSSIWPFHRWLTSSLNSPTPVSAIMHAGLVNGGGFLLVRFAPLYLQHSALLGAMMVAGLVTALAGTLWKLMQNDIKRMLACSTMGQMGFMLVQCGLGLFPAAVAHLVWHGMFKACLFLASGGAAQEKRFDLGYPPKWQVFVSALFCGFAGSLGFAFASGKSWLAGDSTLVLMTVAWLAASQLALSMLRHKPLQTLVPVLMVTAIAGLFYGECVNLIASAMTPMHVMQPQPLNVIHLLLMATLVLAWLSALSLRGFAEKGEYPAWMLKSYVAALNASQPHPATITTHRNDYQY